MNNEEVKEAKETILEIEKKNKPDLKKWFIQWMTMLGLCKKVVYLIYYKTIL